MRPSLEGSIGIGIGIPSRLWERYFGGEGGRSAVVEESLGFFFWRRSYDTAGGGLGVFFCG